MRDLEASIRKSMTVVRRRPGRSRIRVPSRSPLAELRRRSVGPLDLFGQSISAVAPSAAGATIPVALFAVAGDASTLSLLIGFVLIALVVATVTQYARRMVTSGSVYSYAAWAGGVRTATAAGAALLVGTLGITVGVLVGAASSARVLLHYAIPAVPLAVWMPALLVLVAVLGLVFFAIGVRFSTRITLIVELLAVLTIVVVMSILIVANWGVMPPLLPTEADPGAVGAGAAVAVGLFVGFETSATLGAEAQRPFRDVPRAFVLSVVVAAVIFALSFFGQYAGFQTRGAFTAVGDIDPSTPGTSTLLVVALDIGILLSYLAAFIASLNGVIRLVFTLGRDGLLPPTFGRVDRRNRLPMRAAFGVAGLVVLTALGAMTFAARPESVTGIALSTSAVGCGLAYAIACLLLPRFRRKIGEPLLIASVAAYAVGAALVIVVLTFVIWNLVEGMVAVLLPLVLIAGVWAAFALKAHRRGIVEIGVYDQTDERDLAPIGVETRFETIARPTSER